MIFKSNNTSSHNFASGNSLLAGASPAVSMAHDTPHSRSRCKKRVANSACINTSPPESVTPPPDVRKKMSSFITSRSRASRLISRPIRSNAPEGHSSASRKHFAQCRHFASLRTVWILPEIDSGLAHHGQRCGQPLKKTTVRMPSPSFSE